MNLDINSYYNIRNTLILTYMDNYVNTISKITSIMDKIIVNSRFDIAYTVNDISNVGIGFATPVNLIKEYINDSI